MAQKLAIAWIDLSFSVKPFLGKEKLILDKVSGSVDFGSITALMGSSGSGKTTLLKCLNGLNKSGLGKETKICLNTTEKILTCFITQYQSQQYLSGLTVRQTLIYSSKLKNSNYSLEVNHESNVNDLMLELMIADVADNVVDNCSDGQLKRLSIALELTSLKRPNFLCIDEPTTGLDSYAAEIVIESLKRLSRNHMISIITSIHQPNNDLLMMFDNVYILAKGGVCVYSGLPQNLKTHLNECNIECNENQVPIEVMLKLCANSINDRNIKQLSDRTSQMKESLINRCNSETLLSPNGIQLKSKNFKAIDFWHLLLRTITYTLISNWKLQIIKFITLMSIGLILTGLFRKNVGKTDGCFSFTSQSNMSCFEKLNEESIVEQNIDFVFITYMLLIYIELVDTTLTFTSELEIFSNEHRNKWYSSGAYYWAKTLVEMIPVFINTHFYVLITYHLSGQIKRTIRFYKLLYTITAGMFCTHAFGSLVGIVFSKNKTLAVVCSIGLFVSSIGLSNYTIPINKLNDFLQVFSDFVYLKYLMNSALITLYGFGRCPSGLVSLVLYQLGINDDQIFWANASNFVYCFLILKALGLIALIVQFNDFSLKRLVECKKSDNNIETELINFIPTQNLSENSMEMDSAIDIENKNSDNDKSINYAIDNCQRTIENKLLIAWIDLSFTTEKKFFKRKHQILDNISGYIEIGSINALLGPSGAGKTTLLKCIDGRNNSSLSKETKIYLGENKVVHKCFITQDQSQHLLNGLTVRQTLMYASKLKNSNEDMKVNHKDIVDQLLSEMMISDIADNIVEKCSGGERKRVVIASELTSYMKPNLLCIDEPTSGLDSNAAEVVIKCLKSLSRNHMISIMTSIHQPNNDLLMMFDNVYILAKGGVCVYSGLPQNLKTHLSECNIECNENQVPIEVMLKVSSKGISDRSVKRLRDKTSQMKESLINRCNNETLLSTNGIGSKSKKFKAIDFWHLLLRTITYTIRSQWKVLILQFIFYQICGYCLNLLYNLGIEKPDGCVSSNFSASCFKTVEELDEELLVMLNIKYHVFFLIAILFSQLMVTTFTFSSEVGIFMNEHQNGWYSSGSYYWSKSIVDIIPTVITITCFSWIINNYDSDQTYFRYLYLILIGVLCLQSYGYIVGIIFIHNVKSAIFCSTGLFVFQMIFANFLIPIHELHVSLQWLSNLSTFKLIHESIIVMIYGFGRCSPQQFSYVLYLFDFGDERFWFNTKLLLIQFLLLRFIAIIALIVRANAFSKRIKI